MKLINGVPTKKEVQECIDAISRGCGKFHIAYHDVCKVMVTRYATEADIKLLCFYLTSDNTKAKLVEEYTVLCYGEIKITVHGNG